MKTRQFFIVAILIMIANACFAESKAGSRENAELTIYNQNFALVKETRNMELEKGINFVPVADVAATIRPSTVSFKSLSDPNSVVVREQNYQYDLISPNTILEKSIGKKVKIRRMLSDKMTETEGILLSGGTSQVNAYSGYTTGGVVIQTKSGIIVDPIGEIEVMELPAGLISRPTLEWKLESTKSGKQKTEISYLADQITWIADYVAVVDAKDENIDLNGWVTLNNNSGTTFENAALNLMAGDVNIVRDSGSRALKSGMGGGYAESLAMAPQFTEKSFFEYHLYTLAGKTTIKDKESKQISLLSASKAPVKKIYLYDARKSWWGSWRYNQGYRPGESYDVSANKKINIIVEIKNSEENHLGMPLPKGTIRVYKQEESGNQHFVGEDTIDHTPKDEKIRLYLGDAFDVVGEHTRTSFKRISDKETEESFSIKLRNHKDAPVSVLIVEHQFGDWNITESSVKAEKKDASTIEMIADVAKDGETTVNYTVRTRW